MNDTVTTGKVYKVEFSPPLWNQRRSWVLEILKRERVAKVLDVGCGEGTLLRHLTHAPPWRAYSSETPAPFVLEKAEFIHPRELHGLDVLHDDVLYVANTTAPVNHKYGWTRFKELDISLWEGALQTPNPAFEGIECITVCEVIEHLPEDVLEAFAPVLLGNYAPRLLLLTTPCFDFNERFSAPGEENWGFKDPTGRTTRRFRHESHQFEWTLDECVQWCKAAAEEWGYDVDIGSLGHFYTKDPRWDGDGDTLHATHAVVFRRREGGDWAKRRGRHYAEWKSFETQSHKLLVTHHYDAYVGAQRPAPRQDIAYAAKSWIQDIGSSDITVSDVWRDDTVLAMCGGWLEVLIDVLDRDEAFLLHKVGKNAEDWKVELSGSFRL